MTTTLQILIIYGVLRSLGSTLGQFFNAINKPHINTKVNLFKLFLIALPIVPAIQKWGIEGAAVVIASASVATNLYQISILRRFNGSSNILMLAPPLLSLFTAVSISLLSTMWIGDPWARLMFGGVIFAIAFLITAFTLDKFLRDIFIQLGLPLLPRKLRNSVIKTQSILRQGRWHDFTWRDRALSASSKDWQERYDLQWQFDRHDSLIQADTEWVLNELKHTSAKKVLEIGPGTGHLSKILQENGYQVSVVDISQTVLHALATPHVDKIQARAETLPFKNDSFDCLVATHLLEHVDNVSETIAQWLRVTKTKLIIIVPKEEKPDVPTNYHLQYFSTEKQLVEAIGLKTFTITSHTNPNDHTKYMRYSGVL